eukprot:scaffold44572_cov39-Phaeocystis_antarctica.AAC.2
MTWLAVELGCGSGSELALARALLLALTLALPLTLPPDDLVVVLRGGDQAARVELHLVGHRRRAQVARVMVIQLDDPPSLPVHAQVTLDARSDGEPEQAGRQVVSGRRARAFGTNVPGEAAAAEGEVTAAVGEVVVMGGGGGD